MMHTALLILVSALVTAGIRFAPFLIFSGERKTPETVLYLGRVLPGAIMGMLVVYCLRGMSFTVLSGWLPAVLASLGVVALHVWRRSTLLSILGGTVIYMALIHFI